MNRFLVIEGGETPKAGHSNKREPEFLICKCGSSTVVQTKINMIVEGGKVSRGAKTLHCFHCRERLI